MSKTVDLGPVSAYALAVKYGYGGTEEEWVAETESKRKEAIEAAATASNSAQEAADSASIADGKMINAANSAIRAESYAVGGTGTRESEDTDNAKNYYEKSKEIFENIKDTGEIDTATTTDTTLNGSKASIAKINAVRGKSEQKSFTGKQLLNASGLNEITD
ncbi:MAG: hypothetical protein J6A75_01640, partial [Lachnospiraceae bacterium]|nr:hypothetical protein [Lachnospiraceae bacterium]